jgi:23S rRNA pseudouridine1911/1915/1917 synthase
VPTDLDGERLDRVVARLFDLSRSRARTLADAGAVYLDGRRARRLSLPVAAAQVVELEADELPAGTEADVAVHLVHADERVVVAMKPAGVPTSPTRVAARGTLEDALRRRLSAEARRPLRVFPIHRLDREASGLVMFALDPAAAAFLSEELAAHRIGREYLCAVRGAPAHDEGTLDRPLAPIPGDARHRMTTTDPGAPGALAARTQYRVLARWSDATLVTVRLETGRTHQIRAHFAADGCPLVGDRLYGRPDANRLALHAQRLWFTHPDGRAPMARIDLAPPLPLDLASLLAALAAS